MSQKNTLSSICTAESDIASSKNILSTIKIDTPLGEMVAVADDEFLYILCLGEREKMFKKIQLLKKELNSELVMRKSKILSRLEKELENYFNGTLKKFTVPIKFIGTDFQKEIWTGLTKILYGKTLSYGELAVKVGRESKHARAVGAAAGANPLIIIVPCHRLLAHNQKLGGFGCGTDKKIWLLNHETKYKDT